MIRTDEALVPLVQGGTITAEQAQAVKSALEQAGTAQTQSRRRILSEILSYVGGGVVIVSASFIVSQVWEPLGVVGRPAVLGGAAVILFAAGWVLAGRVGDDAGRRLASSLLTGAAALTAGVVWTVLDPWVMDSAATWAPPMTLLCAAAGALVVSVLGYRRSRSALGLIAMSLATFVTTFALGWTVTALVEGTSDQDPVAAMLAVAAVGAGWLALSLRGVFAERLVGEFAGIIAMGVGIQALRAWDTGEWLVPVLLVLGGLALMGIYAWARQWPLLVGGVAGVILGGSELLVEYTEGLVAAVGSLVLGLLMLGVGLRLLRDRRPGR
jgi:hypothetical protein